MEKCGMEGNYQNILTTIIFLISYLSGGCSFIFPYLFYQDPYHCPTGMNANNCKTFVCSLPADQRGPYIPEPSMKTLGNKFGDYRCDS